MMKLSIIFVAGVLFSCAAKKNATTTQVPNEHTEVATQTTTPPTKNAVHWEKIVYNTSGCFGQCPVYHLEITNSNDFKLYAETVYLIGGRKFRELDSTKMGNFKGVITKEQNQALTAQLNRMNLDSLKIDGPKCCDGSIKTIIVYYNGGKRKYMQAMFPPEEMNSLSKILYDICQNNDCKRTDEQFEIER